MLKTSILDILEDLGQLEMTLMSRSVRIMNDMGISLRS